MKLSLGAALRFAGFLGGGVLAALLWREGARLSGAQQLPEPLPPIVTPTPLPSRAFSPPQDIGGEAVAIGVVEALRAERGDLRPPLVRVLLTAPQPVVLPQPGRRYLAVVEGQASWLRGPLAVQMTVADNIAIQVGAFRARENAEREAARLARAGFAATVRSGGEGLHRVVVAAQGGESGEALRRRLAGAGVAAGMVWPGGEGEVAVTGEGGAVVRGRQVRLLPLDVDPVVVGDRSFRGELLVTLTGQGLQLVNILNLEEYLRGVVPAEMGPRVFPELEALKAQAVAARTYTVTHLKGDGPPGWDLCDTQACQVYAGAGAEHPLSDEAVRATAGLVAVFAGTPIDAMYHSTCGGHTEDAAEQFPKRAAPYLHGVPCRGERTLTVGGAEAAGPWLDVTGRLAAVARRTAALKGVPATAAALGAALAGTARSGVGRDGLPVVFALGEAALLVGGAGRDREEWVDGLLTLAQLELPPVGRGGGREEEDLALTVRLAQITGALREVPGRVAASGEMLAQDGRRVPLGGDDLLVLVRSGAAWRVGGVTTLPGAPATLWLLEDRPVAIEVEPRWEADAGSPWSWWVREFTAAEVGSACGVGEVRRLEILRRTTSGRVARLVVHADRGRKEMPGIDFRYALGLPDNRFVVLPTQRRGGTVFRFVGRGWGHGVGMCQHGAVGLARGGATFGEILSIYYRGVRMARWSVNGLEGGGQ